MHPDDCPCFECCYRRTSWDRLRARERAKRERRAVAALWSSGFLHESSMRSIDAMFGLPERDTDRLAAEAELDEFLRGGG